MNSRTIESNQSHIHIHLAKLVQKHALSQYERPIPDFSRKAFSEFERQFAASGKQRLVVDSCCGTGESTAFLAKQHPRAFVIGLDHSALRIRKHSSAEIHAPSNAQVNAEKVSNYAVLRADVEDVWRLLENDYAGRIDYHTIFYPNPYPKARHIMRRWHGHPLFLPMLRLAPRTELRTNWGLYAEEFAFAASLLGFEAVFSEMQVSEPITAFERKYLASSHTLFQVLVQSSP